MKSSSKKPSKPGSAVPVDKAPGVRVKTAEVAPVVAGVAAVIRFCPTLRQNRLGEAFDAMNALKAGCIRIPLGRGAQDSLSRLAFYIPLKPLRDRVPE